MRSPLSLAKKQYKSGQKNERFGAQTLSQGLQAPSGPVMQAISAQRGVSERLSIVNQLDKSPDKFVRIL